MSLHSEQTEKKRVCRDVLSASRGDDSNDYINTAIIVRWDTMGHLPRERLPPPASPHDHHRLPRTKYMHAL